MGTMTRRPTKLTRKKKAIVRPSVGSLMFAVLVFSAVSRSIPRRYDPNPPADYTQRIDDVTHGDASDRATMAMPLPCIHRNDYETRS